MAITHFLLSLQELPTRYLVSLPPPHEAVFLYLNLTNPLTLTQALRLDVPNKKQGE